MVDRALNPVIGSRGHHFCSSRSDLSVEDLEWMDCMIGYMPVSTVLEWVPSLLTEVKSNACWMQSKLFTCVSSPLCLSVTDPFNIAGTTFLTLKLQFNLCGRHFALPDIPPALSTETSEPSRQNSREPPFVQVMSSFFHLDSLPYLMLRICVALTPKPCHGKSFWARIMSENMDDLVLYRLQCDP